MDTLNFIVGVVLIMLAASYDQFWLGVAIGVLMVLTMRSLSTFVLVALTLIVVYAFGSQIEDMAVYILFGLIILSLALGQDKKPADAYGGGLGGDFGGLMGAPPGGGY